MYFKTADVAGLRIFYREAGDPSKPNSKFVGLREDKNPRSVVKEQAGEP